jgi:isochorismate synthase/2-succinyl-5-enolpyruvyl-6-hydroxy-3-cyclohexene-1-carboxylate synthase/2-succinyl-6-hydroxy-2,4-cyclohexadiene-1-carboxylate synthase/O-succinylbenzoate synthase
VPAFSAAWYKQKLFASLAQKPGFADLEARRCSDREAVPLAQALASMSPGRAPDMWPQLQGFSARRKGDAQSPALRVDFVVGALDSKFVAAARKMAATAGPGVASSVVEVPLCGHAVHLEAPEALVVRMLDALEG